MLVEMQLDVRHVADSRNAIVLQARAEHDAAEGVHLAMLVERVADALNYAAMALAARERRRGDAAGSDTGGHVQHASLAKQRVDLDLRYVQRAAVAAADADLGTAAQKPAHQHAE